MFRSVAVLSASAGRVAGASRRALPAVLEVTDSAARRIRELMANRPDAIGVKLGVRTRGCNGKSYTMQYATDLEPLDEVVEVPASADEAASMDTVKVVVDNSALLSIMGTTMDFVTTSLSDEFVFHNPNATSTCGCGESFTTQ